MFDWDDLRYVLAIARHGTLSSAARRLAVTQPTMGRRLDAFEKHLGTRESTPSMIAVANDCADMEHVLRSRSSGSGYFPVAASRVGSRSSAVVGRSIAR